MCGKISACKVVIFPVGINCLKTKNVKGTGNLFLGFKITKKYSSPYSSIIVSEKGSLGLAALNVGEFRNLDFLIERWDYSTSSAGWLFV